MRHVELRADTKVMVEVLKFETLAVCQTAP